MLRPEKAVLFWLGLVLGVVVALAPAAAPAGAQNTVVADGRPRYDGVQNFLASRGIELPYGRETDGPECETVCGLGNRKNEIFQQLLQRDGVQVFPDAVRQIHRWKRQIGKVAVISASRNCEAVLTAANLATLFDVKVDGNDVARHNLRGKPAPDMFLSAAEQLGVEPAQAMVVEDAMAGVQAGKDGGFGLVIGVARDGARTDSRAVGADLRAAGADMVVGDLTEIELTADAENNGAP